MFVNLILIKNYKFLNNLILTAISIFHKEKTIQIITILKIKIVITNTNDDKYIYIIYNYIFEYNTIYIYLNFIMLIKIA
jgi:hypothetical protein